LVIFESVNSNSIIGVLIWSVAVIKISLSLGTPNVKFAAPCPALWKVFKVIYVEGSPTDYAAITPTASPGSTKECIYLALIKSLKFYLEIFPL